MPELLGLSFLGGARGARGTRTFHAQDPATGEVLPPSFHAATLEEVDSAARCAQEAVETSGAASPGVRASFLRALASGLEAESAELIERARRETGLPVARLTAELARTCHQLRLFAGLVEEGSWLDARIDLGDPERKPTPRPDVRSMRRSLGPVAVFGSSNFPFAFSVAGGDTASALAAGNPVIVKAHPAHPGTSEGVAAVVATAARETGLPAGVFSLLFDDGFEVGQALVRHPLVRAVGFTGSRSGGLALARLAAERPEPIPVFAEMGSVNPVVILPGALRARGRAIAEGLHASFTLGVGQFCTNPGVVLVESGAEGDAFVERLAELTRATPAGPMLTRRIAAAYAEGQVRLRELGAERLAEGEAGEFGACGRAALWQVAAERALAEPRLLEEVFGPSTLVVRYRDAPQLEALARAQEGQLAACVHAEPEELSSHARLLDLLARRAGRLVFDQFPTGVEVNHSMVHGGPFPATSDGRTTSVGARAIERFSRLVAYQNWPEAALPEELRDANPRGIRRLVDGRLTREPVVRR